MWALLSELDHGMGSLLILFAPQLQILASCLLKCRRLWNAPHCAGRMQSAAARVEGNSCELSPLEG